MDLGHGHVPERRAADLRAGYDRERLDRPAGLGVGHRPVDPQLAARHERQDEVLTRRLRDPRRPVEPALARGDGHRIVGGVVPAEPALRVRLGPPFQQLVPPPRVHHDPGPGDRPTAIVDDPPADRPARAEAELDRRLAGLELQKHQIRGVSRGLDRQRGVFQGRVADPESPVGIGLDVGHPRAPATPGVPQPHRGVGDRAAVAVEDASGHRDPPMQDDRALPAAQPRRGQDRLIVARVDPAHELGVLEGEVQVTEVEAGRDDIDVPAAPPIAPGAHVVEIQPLPAAIVGAGVVERNGHALDGPALIVPDDAADRRAPFHLQRVRPGDLGLRRREVPQVDPLRHPAIAPRRDGQPLGLGLRQGDDEAARGVGDVLAGHLAVHPDLQSHPGDGLPGRSIHDAEEDRADVAIRGRSVLCIAPPRGRRRVLTSRRSAHRRPGRLA